MCKMAILRNAVTCLYLTERYSTNSSVCGCIHMGALKHGQEGVLVPT